MLEKDINKIQDPGKIMQYGELKPEIQELLAKGFIDTSLEDVRRISEAGAMNLRVLLAWPTIFDYCTEQANAQERSALEFIDREGYVDFDGKLESIPSVEDGVLIAVPDRKSAHNTISQDSNQLGLRIYGFAPTLDGVGWEILCSMGQVARPGENPVVISQPEYNLPEVFLVGTLQRVADPDKIGDAEELGWAILVNNVSLIDPEKFGKPLISLTIPSIGKDGGSKDIGFILTPRNLDYFKNQLIEG